MQRSPDPIALFKGLLRGSRERGEQKERKWKTSEGKRNEGKGREERVEIEGSGKLERGWRE